MPMFRRDVPVHLRKELDIVFRITGQSIEIFEVRPLGNALMKSLRTRSSKRLTSIVTTSGEFTGGEPTSSGIDTIQNLKLVGSRAY